MRAQHASPGRGATRRRAAAQVAGGARQARQGMQAKEARLRAILAQQRAERVQENSFRPSF